MAQGLGIYGVMIYVLDMCRDVCRDIWGIGFNIVARVHIGASSCGLALRAWGLK